jgi:glycosyltransferase involved in cell wall biosynthesis
MSLVSVIVPVYNTEKYLTECIDSILAQTYQTIEVILVDDGSTDQSAEIAVQKSREDPRISVIRQMNQGVGSARNQGVKMAQGDYLSFIDADDWIEPDMIEQLVKSARRHNSDLVLSGWFQYSDQQDKPKVMFPCESFELQSAMQLVPQYDMIRAFMHNDNGSFPAGKLFRRTIITQNNLSFERDMAIGEDYLFLLRFFAAGERFTFVRKAYYHYRFVSGSTINRYNPKRLQYYMYIDSHKRSLIDEYWGGDQLLANLADAYITRRLIACLYHETMTNRLLPDYGIIREIVTALAGKDLPVNNKSHKSTRLYFAAISKGRSCHVWLMLSLKLYRRRLG